jgi:hypothetical protein
MILNSYHKSKGASLLIFRRVNATRIGVCNEDRGTRCIFPPLRCRDDVPPHPPGDDDDDDDDDGYLDYDYDDDGK